jgi:hypothetical protein
MVRAAVTQCLEHMRCLPGLAALVHVIHTNLGAFCGLVGLALQLDTVLNLDVRPRRFESGRDRPLFLVRETVSLQ